MAQQATSIQASPSLDSGKMWKVLWRVDAVFNLLFGDLLIFAAGSVIDFMGMSEDATNYLRALGVFFALYGLWQLWAARTGHVSRTSFLLADADMTLIGIGAIAAVVLGVEFNDVGTAVMIGFNGIGAFIMAGLWFVGSRQA
jgi:hypothetical protein